MLDELFIGALADARLRQQSVSSSDLEEAISELPPALDSLSLLWPSRYLSVIAEIKRASPSRGQMALISNPAELAVTYQRFGASAISVLTERRGFAGNLDDLTQVRQRVSIPLLRKDFIASEYQILEARARGADMILLIASWLPESSLSRLLEFASNLGMLALVETHSASEVAAATAAGAKAVGINTRNLRTFETDISLFDDLSSAVPDGILRVAESSVKTTSDVERYRDAGAHAVLIGEALVTGDTPRLLKEFSRISL